MDMSRNQQHFIIMSAIYNELIDHSYGKDNDPRKVEEILESLCELPYEDIPEFIKVSVSTSLYFYDEAVNMITPLLINFSWECLPALTQAILLMSYAHYYKIEKLNKRIVIDIAVTLAKSYIEEKQAKFINAILEKLLQ